MKKQENAVDENKILRTLGHKIMFHVKHIYILSISSIVYFLIYHNGSLLGSPAFLGYFLGVIFSFWII